MSVTLRRSCAARLLASLSLLILTMARPAAAFDYYLLALSWSPSWCASEGSDGDAEQCSPERDLGFMMHGLWPQNEDGWPENCNSSFRDPSRALTAAMADVMGSGGLAWHQWKKHGRCSGLSPEDYFALSRLAFQLMTLPDLAERMSGDAVEAAFVAANDGTPADGIVATCRDGLLREVRICLTRELAPRGCGADVLRSACRAGDVFLPSPP